MLFVFRGIRAFQVLLAIIALATGVGAVLSLKAYVDGTPLPFLLVPLLLGLVFIWTFSAALRAPTSFVAISDTGMRIRFAGFVDVVVPLTNVAGARLARWSLVGGLGVRTAFRGEVALVSAWGEAVQVTFRQPVRIWVIPRLLPARATRLTLSLRNPAKLVERLGPPASVESRPAATNRKMKRRGPRTR
ncbi:MAG: hypothetical protein HS107_00120 [Thermoflexaceae bacterium]|nr:hypothetical protein [Thermoflexaceae bacterium]